MALRSWRRWHSEVLIRFHNSQTRFEATPLILSTVLLKAEFVLLICLCSHMKTASATLQAEGISYFRNCQFSRAGLFYLSAPMLLLPVAALFLQCH